MTVTTATEGASAGIRPVDKESLLQASPEHEPTGNNETSFSQAQESQLRQSIQQIKNRLTEHPSLLSQYDGPVTPVNPKVETAAEALELLKAGNERFLQNMQQGLGDGGQLLSRKIELHGGQRPHAVVISCSDSRVAPELVFDQELGDLFVIRLAGNTMGSLARASLLYAINELHTPLIVIMGHQSCGAVTTTLKVMDEPSLKDGLSSDLVELVASIEKGLEASSSSSFASSLEPSDRVLASCVDNVHHQVHTLRTHPDVSGVLEKKEIKVVGSYYSFNGVVTFFE